VRLERVNSVERPGVVTSATAARKNEVSKGARMR
jgi:hypothetical protein